jgi:hypothetical protein
VLVSVDSLVRLAIAKSLTSTSAAVTGGPSETIFRCYSWLESTAPESSSWPGRAGVMQKVDEDAKRTSDARSDMEVEKAAVRRSHRGAGATGLPRPGQGRKMHTTANITGDAYQAIPTRQRLSFGQIQHASTCNARSHPLAKAARLTLRTGDRRCFYH